MDPTARPPAPRRPRRHLLAAAGLALAVIALGACSGDDAATPSSTTGTTAPPPSTTTTAAPLSAGERVYVWSPEVGDCFDHRTLPDEQGGGEITLLLDCALPHEAEVFAVVEIVPEDVPRSATATTSTTAAPTTTSTTTAATASSTGASTTTTSTTAPAPAGPDPQRWPGDDALVRYAQSICPPRYGEFSGLPYELSELEVGWVLPDEEAWNEGDRTLACTVYDPSGTSEEPARLAGTIAGSRR